jgi:hypothetical protein
VNSSSLNRFVHFFTALGSAEGVGATKRAGFPGYAANDWPDNSIYAA